jgi:hypothetical protein
MGLAIVAVLGLGASAQAQTPPPVTNVKVELGQGHTFFHGKPKFRIRGAVSFMAGSDGVTCTDKISLERRVRRVVNRRFQYYWIEIATGDRRELKCVDRPSAPKPVAQRSAVNFYHADDAYRRLLRATPLRVRYDITIAVGGQTAFHRNVTRPVTLHSLGQRYASQPV